MNTRSRILIYSVLVFIFVSVPSFALTNKQVEWYDVMNEEYIKNSLGVDQDNYLGAQCVDVASNYSSHIFPIKGQKKDYAHTLGFGNANQLYHGAKDEYFIKTPYSPDYIPNSGDIIVFGYGTSRAGHVSVVLYADANYMTVVHQNGSGYNPYGSRGTKVFVEVHEYSKWNKMNGGITGYLTPKVSKIMEKNPDMTTETYEVVTSLVNRSRNFEDYKFVETNKSADEILEIQNAIEIEAKAREEKRRQEESEAERAKREEEEAKRLEEEEALRAQQEAEAKEAMEKEASIKKSSSISAYDALVKLDIYRPSATTTSSDMLTRTQAVALIIRLTGQEEAVKFMSETEVSNSLKKVSDASIVPNWAKSNLAYAIEHNIISGTLVNPDGTIVFSPNDNVTGEQFATILARCLEYEVKSLSEVYDTYDVIVDNREDCDKDVVSEQNINRGDAAKIMYDMLVYGSYNGAGGQGLYLRDYLLTSGIIDFDAFDSVTEH